MRFSILIICNCLPQNMSHDMFLKLLLTHIFLGLTIFKLFPWRFFSVCHGQQRKIRRSKCEVRGCLPDESWGWMVCERNQRLSSLWYCKEIRFSFRSLDPQKSLASTRCFRCSSMFFLFVRYDTILLHSGFSSILYIALYIGTYLDRYIYVFSLRCLVSFVTFPLRYLTFLRGIELPGEMLLWLPLLVTCCCLKWRCVFTLHNWHLSSFYSYCLFTRICFLYYLRAYMIFPSLTSPSSSLLSPERGLTWWRWKM